jgi:hypothetical protein
MQESARVYVERVKSCPARRFVVSECSGFLALLSSSSGGTSIGAIVNVDERRKSVKGVGLIMCA